jgi:hypothetical protein
MQLYDSLLRSRGARAAATLALALAGALAAPAARAEAPTVVTNCPGQHKLPVTFGIDCSHVADPAARNLCKPFIENQACKMFPAYREITGIKLEDVCRSIKYTIYDQDKWPAKSGDAGGMALHCAVDYVADYSIKMKAPPKIGPYDTHELLHEYQDQLGAIPYQHILFGPSQAEAMRLAGDSEAHDRAVARMKQTTATFEDDYAKFAARSASAAAKSNIDKCVLAEIQVEETLYLENPRPSTPCTASSSAAASRTRPIAKRFNRAYDRVSEGKSRSFLLAHGCGPF